MLYLSSFHQQIIFSLFIFSADSSSSYQLFPSPNYHYYWSTSTVLVFLITRQLTPLQLCSQTLQTAWWPEAVCTGLQKLDVDTLWQRSVSCQMSVRQTEAAWFPRRYTKETVWPLILEWCWTFCVCMSTCLQGQFLSCVSGVIVFAWISFWKWRIHSTFVSIDSWFVRPLWCWEILTAY